MFANILNIVDIKYISKHYCRINFFYSSIGSGIICLITSKYQKKAIEATKGERKKMAYHGYPQK